MTAITAQDVIKYISMIRVNFPEAFPFFNAKDMEKYLNTGEETDTSLLVKTWNAILKEYPREICNKAVINAITHFKYGKYPKINDILNEIERMREAFEKSDAELWAELRGVLREVEKCVYSFRYTAIDYNGKTQGDNARDRVEEIFNGLSPELKEYCRNQRGLIDISQLSENDMQYEKARFLRVIPTIKERARTRQETPENLAGLIQGLSGKLALDCDGTKLLQGD